LYVTGGTGAAEDAVSVLRKLVRRLRGRIQAEVVDVLLHPEILLDHSLNATPVLVREHPGPAVAFRGELRDPEQLIRALGLD